MAKAGYGFGAGNFRELLSNHAHETTQGLISKLESKQQWKYLHAGRIHTSNE